MASSNYIRCDGCDAKLHYIGETEHPRLSHLTSHPYLSRQERERNGLRARNLLHDGHPVSGTIREVATEVKECGFKDVCDGVINIGDVYEEDFVACCGKCADHQNAQSVPIFDNSSEGWWIFEELEDEYQKIIELQPGAHINEVFAWARYQGFKKCQFLYPEGPGGEINL
jgi:hypothetical protein